MDKLREKNQSDDQRRRAAHAVSCYLAMNQQGELPNRLPMETSEPVSSQAIAAPQKKSQYIDAGYQVKSDSPEWDKIMEAMTDEIRVRHYSRKILKTGTQGANEGSGGVAGTGFDRRV